MNELTDTTPSHAASDSLTECSGGLRTLLTLGDETRSISEIATIPAMREECRALLPHLIKLATEGASHEAIRHIIGSRFALYRITMTPEETAAYFKDYYTTLEGVPKHAIEAGMRAHIKSSDTDPTGRAFAEWMPKPHRLLKLALQSPNSVAGAVIRARKAMAMADELPSVKAATVAQHERKPQTEEEKAAVKRMLAEFIEQLPAKKLNTFNPKPAPVDAGGLTAEMRRHLAERDGH